MIRRTPACLSVLLLAAACTSGTAPSIGLWQSTLSPVGSGSISGTAAAVSQAGRTTISVEIRQAVAGESYAWRLSAGTCAAESRVVGGTALYPALVAGPSRSAGAEAAVPGELTRGGAYSVRISRAVPGGGEQVVACGALTES